MLPARIIPTLLLKGRGFYKTTRFRNPVYLGDPINILRIFNDKEANELFVLGIDVSPASGPDMPLLTELASECFMPLGYGGGIGALGQIGRLFQSGFEKVSLNTALHESPALVDAAAMRFGSQSIVASIDVRRTWAGRYEVMAGGGTRRTGREPVELAREMERRGAGEILLNAIDRDGTMQGYDVALVRRVADAVSIPVIACGGAGAVSDLAAALSGGGASAAAAGSLFVFQGPHRAVLINMPTEAEVRRCLP